jgi:hypothetical protein
MISSFAKITLRLFMGILVLTMASSLILRLILRLSHPYLNNDHKIIVSCFLNTLCFFCKDGIHPTYLKSCLKIILSHFCESHPIDPTFNLSFQIDGCQFFFLKAAALMFRLGFVTTKFFTVIKLTCFSLIYTSTLV